MRRVSFNGKFYSGSLNGVHRVADRLIAEMDRRLSEMPIDQRPDARLLLPRRRDWTPDLKAIRLEEQAGGHSQGWEQLVLPMRARGDVLVNLCNLAPILARRKILLLHDAQFLFPDNSYPFRRRWGHKLLTPIMMRTSARPLTVSHYSRQIIDLTGICPRERVTVLHNGIDHMDAVEPDPSILLKHGLRRNSYVLLFGSIKQYKNVEIIFEAFRDERLRHLRLVVVGAGAEAHRDAGLPPPARAVFPGAIDDAQLRPLYEQALCLVMPSRTEGFGLPPLEAMRLGCPAVIAPAGAMPEICRDAASYADVDAPEQWVEAILRLAGDQAFRQGKITAGLSRADHFTWRAAGGVLLAMIMKLAGADAPQVEAEARLSREAEDEASILEAATS